MIVRKMRAGDIRGALRLWMATEHMGLSGADSPRALRRFLRRNGGLSRVAINVAADGSETIIGTVLAGHDGRRGYLYHLAVHRDARRQGVARRLVDAVANALSRVPIERCHLMLYVDNEQGRQAWRRLGWHDREDIAIMSRDLYGAGAE